MTELEKARTINFLLQMVNSLCLCEEDLTALTGLILRTVA